MMLKLPVAKAIIIMLDNKTFLTFMNLQFWDRDVWGGVPDTRSTKYQKSEPPTVTGLREHCNQLRLALSGKYSTLTRDYPMPNQQKGLIDFHSQTHSGSVPQHGA